MSKNENQEYLKNFVNNEEIGLCERMRSVENLSDENLLKEIAEQAKNPSLKKRAILNNNLKSKSFIEGMVQNEKNEGVQRALEFKSEKLENKK